MENQQIENQPKQRLSQISQEEVDIINDIRELNFGRINIIIQDGVVITKEVTKIIRNSKGRGRGSARQQNIIEDRNVNNIAGNGYNGNRNNIDNGSNGNNGRLY